MVFHHCGFCFDATKSGMNANSHADTDFSSERDWKEDATFPVEWLGFSVQNEGFKAILNGTTASETNTDFYYIERSIDGNVFNPIGREKAKGNSTDINDYQFIDSDLAKFPSPKVYYRLQQIDLNGTFSYSKTLELDISASMATLWASATPIPADDKLTIQYKLSKGSNAQMSVTSNMGQAIYEQSIRTEAGEIALNTSQWANGIYYILLQMEENKSVIKILVQH